MKSTQPVFHADKLYHRITPSEIRFARRSARYLANQSLTPVQIRDALIEQLDLPALIAESIVYQVVTGRSPQAALVRAA